MIASFGFGVAVYSRTRLRWLRAYLLYLACYAVWLLFSTSYFFQAVYLPVPLPGITLASAVVRPLLSLVTLYAGPVFALRIAQIPIGRREWWLLTIPVAFVAGGVYIYYLTGSQRVVTVPNGFFNFYLAVLFLVSALKTEGRRAAGLRGDSLRNAFRPFLWLSFGAYVALLGVNVVAVTAPALSASPVLSLGTAGLYCLAWSLLTLLIFLRRMGLVGRAPVWGAVRVEIPANFIESFDVTEQERDIVEDLVSGLPSEQIADKRFISSRTVETQIDSIFRKCEVNSRLELIRLMERYRPQA